MKKMRIVWLLLWLPLIAFAQLEETQVVISDGLSNDYLKQKIEMNISHFLVACNKAGCPKSVF